MSYIGAHASIAGSMLKGIQYVHQKLNGNAVQIFLGSSHSATLKSKSKIDEDDIKAIRSYITQNDVFLVVHACYLLNFCKYPPSDSKIQYAINNLVYDLNLAKKIGALGVVVHIGYQLQLERQEAYQNMVDGIMKVIDKSPEGAMVILETPAGQGSQIATTIEDFAEMFNMFPKKYIKRLGVCVDTCHVFSAGAEIHCVEGTKKYLKDFDKLIGKEHLVLFHVNDSKKPLNSRKDQHQGLGHGYIYNEEMGGDIGALETLTKFANKNKIPMILETHGGASASTPEKNEGNFADEIMLLNKFAGRTLKPIKDNTGKKEKSKKTSKKQTISKKKKLQKRKSSSGK